MGHVLFRVRVFRFSAEEVECQSRDLFVWRVACSHILWLLMMIHRLVSRTSTMTSASFNIVLFLAFVWTSAVSAFVSRPAFGLAVRVGLGMVCGVRIGLARRRRLLLGIDSSLSYFF